MLPSFSVDNVADLHLRNVVPGRQLLLRHTFGGPDIPDVLFGQSGKWVLFSTVVGSVPNLVSGVLFWCSPTEIAQFMAKPTARPVAALLTGRARTDPSAQY
jgi:hypothetical protein